MISIGSKFCILARMLGADFSSAWQSLLLASGHRCLLRWMWPWRLLVDCLLFIAMPPKKQQVQWSEEHKEALLKGFRDYQWDPACEDGATINKIIKSVPELFKVLQPFFSTAQGGTKSNNNQIYQHYKLQGSEYILSVARAGTRWKEVSESKGAFVLFRR